MHVVIDLRALACRGPKARYVQRLAVRDAAVGITDRPARDAEAIRSVSTSVVSPSPRNGIWTPRRDLRHVAAWPRDVALAPRRSGHCRRRAASCFDLPARPRISPARHGRRLVAFGASVGGAAALGLLPHNEITRGIRDTRINAGPPRNRHRRGRARRLFCTVHGANGQIC